MTKHQTLVTFEETKIHVNAYEGPDPAPEYLNPHGTIETLASSLAHGKG